MDCTSFKNDPSQTGQNIQRPMTAPPTNNQLFSIINRSNSNKKEDDLYQCVKTALVELGEFVFEQKSDEQPIFDQDTQSIGSFIFMH